MGVRRGGVRQRDAMSRGARSIRASRAPMVARKGRAGVQIRAAIESRPEHKKQASGSFDLDDVAAPGSTFSEMAATGKSAAPLSVIAQQAELDVSAAFEEPGSPLSTGTGTAKMGLRGIKANRTNIGALLGCDREQCDVSTAALPRLQRLDKGNKYPVLFYAPEMEALAQQIAGRGRVREQRRARQHRLAHLPRRIPQPVRERCVRRAGPPRGVPRIVPLPEVIFEQLSVICTRCRRCSWRRSPSSSHSSPRGQANAWSARAKSPLP